MYSILACLLFLEEFKIDCQDEHELAFASFFWLVIFSPIAALLLKVTKPGFLPLCSIVFIPLLGRDGTHFLNRIVLMILWVNRTHQGFTYKKGGEQ